MSVRLAATFLVLATWLGCSGSATAQRTSRQSIAAINRCLAPNCNACDSVNPYFCAECKAGHALTPAFSCNSCSPGYAQNLEERTITCVQCPLGTTSTGGVGEASQCVPLNTQPYKDYNLQGKQVQPDAAMWLPSPTSAYKFEMPTLDQIKAVGDPLALQFPFPRESLAADVQELLDLALLRDDPSAVAKAGGDRPRLPLSRFLQLRPQPLGAVYNTLRDPSTASVVQTGRELARYFESETPGLPHVHALNLLFASTPGFSPIAQAQVCAALNLSIYAGLLAAWHYKWDEPTTRNKPRPVEVSTAVTVIYSAAVLPDGSGDGEPRVNPNGFPGTPRHPSYPSGHSVVGGAASEVLSHFFEAHRAEFDNLADNGGLARLWAGIHFRPDHEFGVALGRAVARIVLNQLPPRS